MVAGGSGGFLRLLVRTGYNIGLAVNPNGTLDRVAGNAKISGTVRCSESSGGNSVWYLFTATRNQTIEANTFGSNYSGSVSLWTGSRGSLRQVACGANQVIFDVTAGIT
jgi:hypothetical protein